MRRLRNLSVLALTAAASPAAAQQDIGLWRMHEWGWGWGGMRLGPIFMLLVLALAVALSVALVRWLGTDRGSPPAAARTAREVLDDRYAHGDINREDYLRRRQDIAGD
jgi:putative membrane protein